MAFCNGRHVPVAKLENLVITNVREQLFGQDRLAQILKALIERQGSQDQAIRERRAALERELQDRQEKLGRLYRAIEEGVVELDDELKQRTQTLKQERQVAEVALERMSDRSRTSKLLTPELLEKFSHLMHEKLATGDTQARKAYLQSVLDQVEVGDEKIRILANKTALAAAAMGRSEGTTQVRGFVRKWRARRDSNS